MKPVLDWLGERFGDKVALRTVGRRPLEMDTKLKLEFAPWSLERSREELRKFDIGLMPLEDSEWNRGKCGFKLIQYMAVGAAAVASPVGVNLEIVRDRETGYLALDKAEWKDKLTSLTEDRALRLRMGHSGRERVERCYSLRSALPSLIDVLQNAASVNEKDGP
jgi:glycosyltransferase involved in cell wall biosynthesis